MTAIDLTGASVADRLHALDAGIVRLRAIRDHGPVAQASGYDEAIAQIEAERAELLGVPVVPSPPVNEPAEAIASPEQAPARRRRQDRAVAAPPVEPSPEPEPQPSPEVAPEQTPRQVAAPEPPSDSAAVIAAAESAKAEHAAWSTRRSAQEARLAAIGAELAEIAGQLSAARAARLRGEDEGADVASLVARDRALRDEQTEVGELLAVARSEEQQARVVFEAASAEAAVQTALDVHAERVKSAAALDSEIDELYGALVEVLNARAEIADGARGMVRAGAPVGALDFDWRSIPSVRLRCRIPLPGSF